MSQLERWNTHFSTTVTQVVFDIEFQLAQDPASHNLGTTVWDASIVLAKYLEKNAKKGELSRIKAKGKRCIELGAGMGLAGMAFALLGADVVLTDTTDPVMALLRRNAETNFTPAALKLKDAAWALGIAGTVTVQELDWANTDHYEALHPPFDYVIAADCVYNETAVPHFLNTVLAMVGHRTTVAICNEFRSQSVHDIFMAEFSRHFTVKKVPMSRMDPDYQHPLIHIYIMKRKKIVQPSSGGSAREAEADGAATATATEDVDQEKRSLREEDLLSKETEDRKEGITKVEAELEEAEEEQGLHGDAPTEEKAAAAARFAVRRQGAALAKQLRDVTLERSRPS